MDIPFEARVCDLLDVDYHTDIEKATSTQLYNAISRAALQEIYAQWKQSSVPEKRIGYFSAEFLMGRVVESNLLNMGLLEETKALLEKNGLSADVFEEISDCALGNGGLGRLAACFLDSAATHGIPLDGYGIRYRYGFFEQYFENGFQKEKEDNWTAFGDPWSVRMEEESVIVVFGKQKVRAVPYDMPIIGYGKKTVNTLRLWQAEPIDGFDYELFNEQKYGKAVGERTEAETISSILYPNDDGDKGKKLRLKQQYFFSSASLQDVFRKYRAQNGQDFTQLHEAFQFQLNDTHPVVSIPECVRLLVEEEGLPFDTALSVTRKAFAYTNHTLMPEALETWGIATFRTVLPQLYRYIVRIDKVLQRELSGQGMEDISAFRIIDNGVIHMARLAVFLTHSVNGVAKIHTDLLKTSVLSDWYRLYPNRFNNKTNGITQRRWLALANPEMAQKITETIGNRWMTELTHLNELSTYADDSQFLQDLREIKRIKKQQLAAYLQKRDGMILNTDFIVDSQVKRLHEYKRQLLNAFSILDTYFGIKEGSIREFTPTAYVFGAKAAPGYFRAKGIIKFIHEIARLINDDTQVRDKMQVLFVSSYDVSYAQKIIPATDISEQISTAGTEASGTGNMKFMLNGAVTLGTYDGANIEIVEQAGEENNYIFGARVEEIRALQTQQSYDPCEYLERDKRLCRVVNTLIDGTFSDNGSGMFRELYTSLTQGASWHRADHYFLFHDFSSYCETRLRANSDYRNTEEFARKSLKNIAAAGYFSSDRTIREYARDIWNLQEFV